MDRFRIETSRTLRIVPACLRLAALLLIVGIAGCDASSSSSGDSAGLAGRPAVGNAAARVAVEIPDDAPLVAFLGDSITAGLHLARDEAFPAVLQRDLAADGTPFRLVNAGVSGDTTAGGLSRVDWVLGQEPDVVVIGLGGNDGLRGVPLETVEKNLRAIIAKVSAAGATPLLLGYRIPTNYGPQYAGGFDELYPRLADELGVAFVPYFMRDVAGVASLNLPDGIHPTPKGHEIVAGNVADALAALLR